MNYKLTSDLLTGNELIDEQHRELIDIINSMLLACAKGEGRASLEKTVDFLLQYIDKHFKDEEDLQIKANYPYYKEHKDYHENFKKQFNILAQKLKKEGATIPILAEVNISLSKLITHIKTADKKIGEFLKQ